MKVYFTLTSGINKSQILLDMLSLCLKSAKKNTSLNLYALYDGEINDASYKIFTDNNVNVILCKCSFKDKLKKYYENSKFEGLLNSVDRMLGCFMKFDIALYEQEEETILYSDIDTMFLKDIPHEAFKTKTLAAAPEINKNFDIIKGNRYFSAGIMMLNVKELAKRREKLIEMLENGIEPYQECWDQGFFNELYKKDFEILPLEYNWKPYWGINDNASIIHIHGLKLGLLSKQDIEFTGDMQKCFKDAFYGWLYYTMTAYRLLGQNKDKFIANLAEFLKYSEKEQDKKKWNFSSFFMYWIYKITKNNKLMNKINKKIEKKLKKRNLINEDINTLFDDNGNWIIK